MNYTPAGNKWADGLEHRAIVERVLGRPLKRDECVHHRNEDKADNRNANLLICKLDYHNLIHYRMRAQAATGDANAIYCRHCKKWEVNVGLMKSRRIGNRRFDAHVECLRAEWRAKHYRMKARTGYSRGPYRKKH